MAASSTSPEPENTLALRDPPQLRRVAQIEDGPALPPWGVEAKGVENTKSMYVLVKRGAAMEMAANPAGTLDLKAGASEFLGRDHVVCTVNGFAQTGSALLPRS
jgi:hypothetical protein